METADLTGFAAAQRGDRRAAEVLVRTHQGLVWSVVKHYTWTGLDRDDLYQLGCLGLLKAIQGFDPGRGNRFSTYAVPKIAGEIRRFLRDDGLVNIGRSRRERALLIHRARERLTGTYGREPVLSELAAETGLAVEDIADADLATAPALSLQAEGREGGTLETLLASESSEEALVERVALGSAVDRLPENQRKLIFLRYYKALTQTQTARILGVSQVQVSRLEKKALAFLRRELGDS